jgi:hypothetical protein
MASYTNRLVPNGLLAGIRPLSSSTNTDDASSFVRHETNSSLAQEYDTLMKTTKTQLQLEADQIEKSSDALLSGLHISLTGSGYPSVDDTQRYSHEGSL